MRLLHGRVKARLWIAGVVKGAAAIHDSLRKLVHNLPQPGPRRTCPALP